MPNPGSSNPNASIPVGDDPDSAQRQLLHQLNNIFASIHSSLDLALANADRPEGRSFLVQAQEGARRGANLVNQLRFRGRESTQAPPDTSRRADRDDAEFTTPALETCLEGSERILVAEDEESIRMLIRAVLNYRGYDVVEATDGDEAVRLFEAKGPFDLVILDLRMQNLDGPPALAKIRTLNPLVPALALSGFPFDHQGLDDGTGRDGFDARLSKPFNNTELVKLVRQLLNRSARAAVPPEVGSGI